MIFALIIPPTIVENTKLRENEYFSNILATLKQVDFFHKKILFFANARKIEPIIVISLVQVLCKTDKQ